MLTPSPRRGLRLANKSVVHLVDPSSIIHKVRPMFCVLHFDTAMRRHSSHCTGKHGRGEWAGDQSRDNEPLALVDVQLAGTSLHAVRADDGTFHIAGVAAGDYVLQASTVDFYLLRQEFTLAPGRRKPSTWCSRPSNTRITDSVTVSTDPFEVETQESAASFTLEGEERKNLASVLADDPLKAVESVPGVTSNNDFLPNSHCVALRFHASAFISTAFSFIRRSIRPTARRTTDR